MSVDGSAIKSVARTAGAVLVAGAALAFITFGQRDAMALGLPLVLGLAAVLWGSLGGAADAAAAPGATTGAAAYALADHSHPQPAASLPGGDLSGSLADARVAALQGVALSSKKPSPGMVLIYNGTAWGPGPVPVAPGSAQVAPAPAAPAVPAASLTTARAVGRGVKEFDIAAAGEIEVSLAANGILAMSERSSYRGLKGQNAARGERPNLLVLKLQAMEPGSKALPSDRYVVSLTPVDDSGLMRDYRLSLRAPVRIEADGSLQLTVLAESGTLAGEASLKLRFQVLVTRFEA